LGTDKNKIVTAAVQLLNQSSDFKNTANPYGDGKAAIKVVEYLRNSI